MASALITIDQAANPSPVGQKGRARDDLILGQPVTLRNADDTDVNRWRWSLVDVPIGSAATLSSLTAAQVTFTPDIAGSYLARLAVNDGIAGQIDRRVAGSRDTNGFLFPAASQAAGEANYLVLGSPNQNNWAKEVENILRQLSSAGGEESFDYASTAAYQTIKDLGEVPEDEVWSVEATISAGAGQPGLIFSSIVQLRGTARRAAGGGLTVDSAVLTQGNLPGDSAQLLANGNNAELQFITTRVDDINTKFIVRLIKVETSTA